MEAWAQQHLESPSRQATKDPPNNWQEVWRAAVPTLAVGVLCGLTSVMGPLKQCPSGLCNNVQTARLQYASAKQLRPLPYMLPARQNHVQRATSLRARGDSPQRLGGRPPRSARHPLTRPKGLEASCPSLVDAFRLLS